MQAAQRNRHHGAAQAGSLGTPSAGWRKGGIAGALVLVGLLAACTGAPSDADAHAALQRHFADTVAPAQKHFGPQAGRHLVPTVHAVALQGCSAREGGQYLCDAQVTLHSKVLGQRQATTRLLLVHDQSGWKVLSQL